MRKIETQEPEVQDDDFDVEAALDAVPHDERQERWNALEGVAKSFSLWRPAPEVLTQVRSVRTIFPMFDRATRVGGYPIDRVNTCHGPSNHGKAQPVDEPVLTPNGWKAIGDLWVGDCVVGSNGQSTIVEGVFPQGTRPIYDVVFDDGSSTRTCAEHLWVTTTTQELNRGRYTRGPRPSRERYKTSKVGSGSVKTTQEIASTLEDCHYVALPEAVQLPEVSLPVDPYVVGLLLGDGGLTEASWRFTSEDIELHTAVENEALRHGDRVTDASYDRCRTSRIVHGEQGSKVVPQIRHLLRQLDGLHSHEKFVPHEYLWTGVDDRLALLQGLMDTDGSVSNEGTQAQYSTTSPMLRDAVVHLTRSLGGRALTYKHSECPSGDAWNVMCSFGNGINPFRLQRKATQWKVRTKVLRRRVVMVCHVGEAECVCIKVDAPDALYITKDFVPTHNTAFSLGLGLSFLKQGHIFAHIDAEMTTPSSWIAKLFGDEVHNPGFVAMRPRNYEEAINGVKELTETVAEARAKGNLPDDTTALIVVDSIRKLVPKSLLAKLEKDGADGLGGRAQQLKAAMNQAWLDDLTPQLYHNGASVLLIARESERPNATDDDRKYDNAWQVQGGKGIIYDASLVMRITRSAWVYGPKRGDKPGPVLGEKIKVSIWKTKVESKDDKHAIGFFHLSNGTLTPEGFDRARDVLELATSYGTIEQSGSWYSYNGKKLGQGKDAVVKVLNTNHALLTHIENACREEFKPEDVVPMGHDAEEESEQ